jgi:hypothetical protein
MPGNQPKRFEIEVETDEPSGAGTTIGQQVKRRQN